MVKVIIDCWDEKVSEIVLGLQDCVLIVTQKCVLTPGIKNFYKGGVDVDEAILKGNFFFVTSDDFQRGLIIGKTISKFPFATIKSSRPEIIKRYLGATNVVIESLPVPVQVLSEELTFQGPNIEYPFKKHFQTEIDLSKVAQNKNIPNFPHLPEQTKLVEPIHSPPKNPISRPEIMNPPSSSKFISEKPNPIFGKLNEVPKPQMKIEKRPYENQIPEAKSEGFRFQIKQEEPSDLIKEYLSVLVGEVLETNAFFDLTTFNDLYQIVFQKVRELVTNNKNLKDSESIELTRLSLKSILRMGFFIIPTGRTIDEIVDNKEFHIELLRNIS